MRVFRDLDIVEHLGSGIPRIVHAYGKEAFEIRAGYVRTIFFYKRALADTPPILPKTSQLEAPVEAPVELSATEIKIVRALYGHDLGRAALLEKLGYSQRTGNFKKALDTLLTINLIEYTIPEKINSRLQKYRLTKKGKSFLNSLKQDPHNASE